MSDTRILLVDDEPNLRQFLQTGLSGSGYRVELAGDGIEAVEKAASWHPDLILLDLGLPGLSGFDACRLLRAWSQTPIIVLSVYDSEQDKITALDLGADDYVTKPFSIGELLARIRVALRHTPRPDEPALRRLDFGELRIDTVQRQVRLGEQDIYLTRKEYELLLALAMRAGSVLTYSQLLRDIWGNEPDSDLRTLRVLMGQLRRKINDSPTDPRFIFTESGVGYRFRPLPL